MVYRMPRWIHSPPEKQNFVMALLNHNGLQLTQQAAEDLLTRGNFLMPGVESFFAPMAGTLSVSDTHIEELEGFIDEVESLSGEIYAETLLRGE